MGVGAGQAVFGGSKAELRLHGEGSAEKDATFAIASRACVAEVYTLVSKRVCTISTHGFAFVPLEFINWTAKYNVGWANCQKPCAHFLCFIPSVPFQYVPRATSQRKVVDTSPSDMGLDRRRLIMLEYIRQLRI